MDSAVTMGTGGPLPGSRAACRWTGRTARPDQRATFGPVRHPACDAHGMNCVHTRSNDQTPPMGILSRRWSPISPIVTSESVIPAAGIHRAGEWLVLGAAARDPVAAGPG